MMHTYTNAKYLYDYLEKKIMSIRVDIDGREAFVPINPEHRIYVEMMQLVDEGKLVIEEPEIKE